MKKAEAVPAPSTVSKAPDSPEHNFGDRLNKLENMFARVEAMEAMSNQPAHVEVGGESAAHVETESQVFSRSWRPS